MGVRCVLRGAGGEWCQGLWSGSVSGSDLRGVARGCVWSFLLTSFSFEVLLGSGRPEEPTASPPVGYTPLSHLLSLKQVCTLTHNTPTVNSSSGPLNERLVSCVLYVRIHV